jgi:Tfp pilus assembly protein PilF
MDEFDRGCEYFEEGELLKAEKVFKSVLARMPDHLDAIHHLAMVQSEQGSKCQARDLWEQSSASVVRLFHQNSHEVKIALSGAIWIIARF